MCILNQSTDNINKSNAEMSGQAYELQEKWNTQPKHRGKWLVAKTVEYYQKPIKKRRIVDHISKLWEVAVILGVQKYAKASTY
jgi:hypothetical protein